MNTLLKIILLLFVSNIFAGHHFESNLAKKYPQLDLTDVYVFKSSSPNKTVFIMGFNPTSKLNSFENYSTNGIYRFCIGFDKNFSKGISPTFTFKDNKIQFYLPHIPDPIISETGELIAEGPIDRILELSNGIKIFTGTVSDLFQGNSVGIRQFKENAAKGIFDLSVFDVGEEGNIFKKLLSTVIVLEVPNELLAPKVYYYATTAVEMEQNHWHRVNRISHVLFPHLYLLDQTKMGRFMDSNHIVDQDIALAIYNNTLHYASIAPYQKDAKSYAKNLTKMVYPDIIEYEVGTEAIYTIQKINGRPLQADAMDVALALLVGSGVPINDKVSINLELFQQIFPYVIPKDDIYLNASDKVVKIELVNKNIQSAKEFDKDIKQESKKGNIIWYLIITLVIVFILLIFFRKKK